MPKRERGMNQNLIPKRFRSSGFGGFDGIVDLADGSANQQGEDEGGDVPLEDVDLIFGQRLLR